MTALRPTLSARPRARTVLMPAIALGALLLAGCSATNPITTAKAYSASDGVRVDLATGLTAENLMILTAQKGAPGTLLGALTNNGTVSDTVTLTPDGASPVTVHVGAGQTVLLSPRSAQVTEVGITRTAVSISAVTVPPGAVASVQLVSGTGGAHTVSVPVLDGSLPEYSTLVPTQAPTQG